MCTTEVFEDLVVDNDYGLFIRDGKAKSLGFLDSAPGPFESWRIRRAFDTVLAILVDDPGGVEAYEEAFEDYEHAFPITVHTGPFVVEGSAMSPDNDAEWLDTLSYSFFPIKDAKIACEIPKSDFGSVNASLLLINASVGYGYSVVKA